MSRRAAIAVLAVVVLAVGLASAIWRTADDGTGPRTGSALPTCTDLPGSILGQLGEDPAWNGCRLRDGTVARPIRYECSGLRDRGPTGDERSISENAGVVFVPATLLRGVVGQQWRVTESQFARPFMLLVPYRCDVLRSLPSADLALRDCNLVGLPVSLDTTQGCQISGIEHRAVGRQCSYPDGDQGRTWEQWWLEPDPPGFRGQIVFETQPDERWALVRAVYRDERCGTTPLEEWDPRWRPVPAPAESAVQMPPVRDSAPFGVGARAPTARQIGSYVLG